MAIIHVRVRVADKVKTVRTPSSSINVGRDPNCSVYLPFRWLSPTHLVIERQSGDTLRARLGDAAAAAQANGQAISTAWTTLPTPARVSIPTPRGHSIVLELNVTETDLDMFMIREPGDGEGATDVQLDVASATRFAPERVEQKEELTASDWHAPIGAQPTTMRSRERVMLWSASAGAILLVLMALGVNRYRASVTAQEATEAARKVNDTVNLARSLLARREYSSAKAALDTAETMALKRPSLREQLVAIRELKGRRDIQLGAAGYVENDGLWIPGDQARAWREARERDEPKIVELEQKAAAAMQAERYGEACAALEQAVAVIEAFPVLMHPRYASIRERLENTRKRQLAAEMAQRGLVLHEGKWISQAEKTRRENAAKGLVEYEGEWMTIAQMEESKRRGGTGKVQYQGKWVTPDQKMELQGYVRYNGAWMRPEERDAILAKEAGEKRRADEATAAEAAKKAEQERAEKLKPVAYRQSQVFLLKRFDLPGVTFPPYGDASTYVAYDDGWYVVRGTFEDGKSKSRRTYYCKLKPRDERDWQADTVVLADN